VKAVEVFDPEDWEICKTQYPVKEGVLPKNWSKTL
jgi:hypothetical protein